MKLTLFIIAFVGFVWASTASESDLARCEGKGFSRETCLAAVLPQ